MVTEGSMRARIAAACWVAIGLLLVKIPAIEVVQARTIVPRSPAASVDQTSSLPRGATVSADNTSPPARSSGKEETSCDSLFNFYLGNLHSHTSYSDGQSTPAHAFEYARDTANIDFLAVTDHHGALTDSEYADVLFQADAYTQDGVFIAIAGQEWTSSLYSHSTVFDADHVFTAPVGDYDAFYDELAASGCTANFNHPSAGAFAHYAYSSVGDSGVNAVEVRDDKEQGYYIKILNKGWHVGTDGSQDNHSPDWGNGSWWTIALAGSLTKADILDATRHHRTYSTYDRNMQLCFQAEDHWMGEEFVHDDDISFSIAVYEPDSGERIRRLELFQNGQLVNWITIDSSAYHWQPDIYPPDGENYYFVKVYKTDGKRAWSSPIWIDCATGLPATPLLCSPTQEEVVSTTWPAMVWYSSDNAGSYTMQLSTSDNFPAGPNTVTAEDIADTFYTVGEALLDETEYFWRVSAANDSASSNWSGVRSFFVDLEAMFSGDSEIRLTSHPLEDVYPSIFQSSAETWLAWTSWRMSFEEIYYKVSSDNGETWSSALRLTNGKPSDNCPVVAEDRDGNIWVVWDTNMGGDREIFYKIYDGVSWSTENSLTSNSHEDVEPSAVQTADSLLWVIWASDKEDENYELYYKVFDGISWSGETRLTNTPTQDRCPEILQLSSGEIWVVWHTWFHGCFHKVFDGISWSDEMSLLDSTAHYPSIAQMADGTVVLTYIKENIQIPGHFPWAGSVYYQTYQNSHWSAEKRLAGDSNSSLKWTSVTQTGDGRVWVAYQAIKDGIEDVYARRTDLPDPPEAIDDLSISLVTYTESSSVDIRLLWSEPSADQGIARYIVYRSIDPTLSGDSLAGVVGNDFTDPGAAGDTGMNYYYTVKAVDGGGQKSSESNKVGEFDGDLVNAPPAR
jgi:hypothetical protein